MLGRKTLFVEGRIVRQLYLLFSSFDSQVLSFRCIESFPYCPISESDCLSFQLMSFLWYLDSVCQLLGSYGCHVLVVDPVKWAKLCPRAESLQFETLGLLVPSSANLVCGKRLCDNSDQRQIRTEIQIRTKDKFGPKFEIRPKLFC